MFTFPRLTADEVGKESRVESHFRLPLTLLLPLPLLLSPSLSLSLLCRSVGRELRAAGTTIALATQCAPLTRCVYVILINFCGQLKFPNDSSTRLPHPPSPSIVLAACLALAGDTF